MSQTTPEPAFCDHVMNVSLNGAGPTGSVVAELEHYEAALLMLGAFGGASLLLAFAYNAVRRRVFRDADSLDTVFHAGGRVTSSLTMVTVGVQMLWPADLLQGATVTAKYGIAGAFWFSTAIVTNIILFPLLSLQFKTRAPGAKTFLQVIRARFGKNTHILFCCLALLTNLVVLIAIIISSKDLFQALVKDASEEFCVLIMAVLFGSYSLVGGLGSTFYVSYLNAIVTFALLVVLVFCLCYDLPGSLSFGSLQDVYERVQCLQGPEGNLNESFVTFWSKGSLVWMVQSVQMSASTTFCDQASWQSRIAAKPLQGVLGFFGATFLWFAVPSTLGTTAGMVYLSYSAGNVSRALSDSDINAGLVTPFIAQQALGRGGAFMILTMFTMLMMSTGSGEVMGVSSIIVYDFIQSYVYPFRKGLSLGHCILCGKVKAKGREAVDSLKNGHSVSESETCRCASVLECEECKRDIMVTNSSRIAQFLPRKCTTHGSYKYYEDMLLHLKNWTILWLSLGIVPFGQMAIRTGVDLNWVLLTGCIITIPCFPGVILSIVWVKTTAKGMFAGGISGLICGITAILISASTLQGGLGNFVANTSHEDTVLAGSSCSLFVSLIVTVVVSLFTHTIHSAEDAQLEWQKVREIENPLHPWVNFYREEFPDLEVDEKPTYKQIAVVFRKTKVMSIVGCVLLLPLFIVFIPGLMASMRVLNASQFASYLTSMHAWCFIMATVVFVVVPVEEGLTIWREWRRSRNHESLAQRQNIECEVQELNADRI